MEFSFFFQVFEKLFSVVIWYFLGGPKKWISKIFLKQFSTEELFDKTMKKVQKKYQIVNAELFLKIEGGTFYFSISSGHI